MRDEHVLGWYNLQGTTFVSLDVVDDPLLLNTVANHEITHHVLAASTPHGFLQQAIEGSLDLPWVVEQNEALRRCRDLLFDASRLPQEAAATYCGLTGLEGEELQSMIGSLPEYYRTAFSLFEDLLPTDAVDTITRVRAVRGLACRALQTPIMDDWLSRGLHDPKKLSDYLSLTLNSPEHRLKLILQEIAGWSLDQIVSWAGYHRWSAHEVTLEPGILSPLGNIEFFSLPILNDRVEAARRILATLSVSVNSDLRLILSASVEIAIEPPSFGIHYVPNVKANDQSFPGVDFVIVDRNVFAGTSVNRSSAGEARIPGGHARLLMFRPQSRLPLETIVPLSRVATALDAIDPKYAATICVGTDLIFDHRYSGPGDEESEIKEVLDELMRWTTGRNVVLYTGGTRAGVLMGTSLLKRSSDRLHSHTVRSGREWGLVLFRRPGEFGPLIIHPTLAVEWERLIPGLSKVAKFDLNVEASTFYNRDYRNVLPVLRFLRSFVGHMLSEEDWDVYWRYMAASIVGDGQRHPRDSEI